MKKLLAVLLVLVLVAGLAACGNNAPAPTAPPAEPPAGGGDAPAPTEPSDDPVVRLVYACVNPPDTLVGRVGARFAEKVYEYSGGTIIIEIQHSGVLGSEEHVLDDMLGGLGTIHIARLAPFSLNGRGAQYSRLLGLPYAFESREDFWNFATSPLADRFLAESLELGLGLRGLFYGEEGFRHFFTSVPVAGIEDLNNLTLRVSVDPMMVALVNGLGAHAEAIPFTELYSAIQTGVVDGAEQPIINYEANMFHEVAPYLILNGHSIGALQLVILESVWQDLTPNQQDAITRASAYVQAYNRQIVEEIENEALDRLRAAGVTVVEVTDMGPWQTGVAPLVAEEIAGMEDVFAEMRGR